MTAFTIVSLPESFAARVRATRDDGLGNTHLEPTRVAHEGSAPCRVCLEDAREGEDVLLFSYDLMDRPHPYRSLGPIFVHAHSCTRAPGAEVPRYLRRRLLAVRGYDALGMMVDADVVEGVALEPLVERLFADVRVAFLNVHAARVGCFLCRIERA